MEYSKKIIFSLIGFVFYIAYYSVLLFMLVTFFWLLCVFVDFVSTSTFNNKFLFHSFVFYYIYRCIKYSVKHIKEGKREREPGQFNSIEISFFIAITCGMVVWFTYSESLDIPFKEYSSSKKSPFLDDEYSHNSDGSFSCSDEPYCNEINSCEEAEFYYHQCGLDRLDGDNDGIPCETICY